MAESRADSVHAHGSGYSSGGGAYAFGGIRAAYSLISGNMAAGSGATPTFGGGIFARSYSAILETAVARNHAERAGGFALAAVDDNPSLVFQSTISGNSADVIGGMYSREALYLYNSTIADNTARHTTLNGDVMGAGLHCGGGARRPAHGEYHPRRQYLRGSRRVRPRRRIGPAGQHRL